MQQQFVVLDGAAQILLDHSLEGEGAVHLRLEEGVPVPAAVLRLIERRVGEPQQRLAVGGILRCEGDADRAADRGRDAHDDEGFGQRLEDALAQRRAAGREVAMGLDDAELVAADAGDGVAAAHEARQALRDLADEFVARGVAIGVVHRLEAVEIDQHHRQALAGATEMGEFLIEPQIEGAAVGQERELVLTGEALDLALADGNLVGGAAQALNDESEDAAEEQADTGQRPDELAQHGVTWAVRRPAQPGAGGPVGSRNGATGQRVGRHVPDDADVGHAVALRQLRHHRAGDTPITDDLERPEQLRERALPRRHIDHHHAERVEAVMGQRPGRLARPAAHVRQPVQWRSARSPGQRRAEMLQPVIAGLARRAVTLDAGEDKTCFRDDIGAVEFEEARAETGERVLQGRERIGAREGALQVAGGRKALEAQLAQTDLALDGGLDPVTLPLGLEPVGVAGDGQDDQHRRSHDHDERESQRRDRTLQHPCGCIRVGQFPDGRRRHQRSWTGHIKPDHVSDVLISR